MNAVKIEEAVTELAEKPFAAAEFPYQFLTAFGNKATTIRRLRTGSTNAFDLHGGMLQRSNIHIAVAAPVAVGQTLAALRASPVTAKAKAKAKAKATFILATDGDTFEADEVDGGETVACAYADFPNHLGFFLPLAPITTVKQIRENSFDTRATGQLNRLYVEPLKDNPAGATADRRPDINHFMARLIFSFFAEDTAIFKGEGLFAANIELMSARGSSNTHGAIGELFRTLNTSTVQRATAKLPCWAVDVFPYVNGGLFSGSPSVPRFSRIARSYLLHISGLDWTKINPDIFGSMIQAVANDEERGALGTHYTSVPNILKVLNLLFVDNLRSRLDEADDNSRMLLNLRRRMVRIGVFDPACGRGNSLVIAYKEMRAIEAVINKRRGEADRVFEIPLPNFRGIELRDFPAEVARLALIIAEYQDDVLYRRQKLALAESLPLNKENWITSGNALRLDWLNICPPTRTGVKHQANDLLRTPIDQAQIDFENEGGATFICWNPPHYGSHRQQEQQHPDLKNVAGTIISKWKFLDYFFCWLLKAAGYAGSQKCRFAFVCTSSVADGLQVALLWPHVLGDEREIYFARRPFKWSNLAKSNEGVTVVVVGIKSIHEREQARIYAGDNRRTLDRINSCLVPAEIAYVATRPSPVGELTRIIIVSISRDFGNLISDLGQARRLVVTILLAADWVRRDFWSDEIIKATERYCRWISDWDATKARTLDEIACHLEAVEEMRRVIPVASTNELTDRPYRFVYLAGKSRVRTISVGGVSPEKRPYLPIDVFDSRAVISSLAFAVYDGPLWSLAIIGSRLHLVWVAAVRGKVWVAAVRGKLETRYRYSNTIGWNTFRVPKLTEKNKADLTRRAEDILLAREAHFPATIADLYDPNHMPAELREPHERNDEVLERIYIGRRFRNDTERLEKLFGLYAKTTALVATKPARRTKA